MEVEAVTPPRSTSIAATSSAPLIKDFFRGRVHLELFEFPELQSIDEMNEVNLLHERAKHAILQMDSVTTLWKEAREYVVDSTTVDRTNQIPRETIADLANYGLLGLQVDQGLGGLGLTNTQAARVWEAAALDGGVYALLDSHNALALRAITQFGSDEQKRALLPGLVNGDHVAAFCLHETNSGSDLNSIAVRAEPMPDGQNYRLFGEKSWVTNGDVATRLIVFARVPSSTNDKKDSGSDITAFVVNRDSIGIHSSPVLDTFGLRGAQVTNLTFDNVMVPTKNILGKVGSGSQLAKSVVDRQRLDISAASCGLLRYLITYVTELSLRRHQFGRPIGDFGLVQAKLSDLALNVYAMESGVFYFTGLLDAQPGRDLSLELAALKLFSTEALWSGTNHCMQLSGRMGLSKEVPFERYLRDARTLLLHGGANDLLRLSIAGAGMQHCGPQMQDTANKLRYFLRHPVVSFRTTYRMRARQRGWFADRVGAGLKVTEGGASPALHDHLHPNLSATSKRLAHLSQRFQNLSEAMLIHSRAAVVDEQMALGRAADSATDLLITSICLGRASRAISIGIQLHDYELRLAMTFAKLAFQRIQATLIDQLDVDRDRHRVASEMLSRRCYPPAHPLTRVW